MRHRNVCLSILALLCLFTAACSNTEQNVTAEPTQAAAEAQPEVVRYAISDIDAERRTARIEAVFPVKGPETILYLPTWTPGYYVREDFKQDVVAIEAFDAQGHAVPLADAGANRWIAESAATRELTVRYTLSATRKSVSLNEITPDYAVFNGTATYLAAKGSEPLPHQLRVALPEGWSVAIGLPEISNDSGRGFLAENYEELVDSPLMAGVLGSVEFVSGGTPHRFVYNKGVVELDEPRIANDLKRMADATRAFWNAESWPQYVFLIAFREAPGGLEHRYSTFVNINPERFVTPRGYDAFISLLAHEYQHAFNVKRLRPLELGPFDYENPPTVSTLWISEGLTSYYSNLMLLRSGLIDINTYLAMLSHQITALQKSPGRLKQSLYQSSMGVWDNSLSGVGASDETVSYYIKGEVAGFLLDAYIRQRTNGARSLDDVMRLAYQRYSGARGFTPEEFQATAEEASGLELGDWLSTTIGSATELDYLPALDWYGLELSVSDDQWQLSMPAQPPRQKIARLTSWLGGGKMHASREPGPDSAPADSTLNPRRAAPPPDR